MHRLVVALVTLIGLVGAAFVAGYLLLFAASTDRAAALAPEQTAVYVNVYLQPSTGQQMNLGELIGRLPGFADDASLDEKVDQVVQNLLAGTGIDYRADIKPWLGDQVAVAAWPVEGDLTAPATVVIAEVENRAAAERGLAALAGDAGLSFAPQAYQGAEIQVAEGTAYAFVGDMLVVGEEAPSVETVVDVQAGAASLGGREAFRATMADLPADHLASVFVDLAGLAEATEASDELSDVSTAGAALVAEPDGLRLSGGAPLRAGDASPSGAPSTLGSEPSILSDWMPEDTVAELVVFGLRQTLEDAEAAAGSTPEAQDVLNALDTFRALAAFGLGVDLDNDVLPLLDREVGIAISGLGAEGLPSGQLLLRPEDPEAAADTLDRLVDGLASTLGGETRTENVMPDGDEVTIVELPDIGEVAFTISDEVVIIGMGLDDVQAAIDAHTFGSSLAASDAYGRTFEIAGTRAGNEAYVDIGAFVELLGLDTDLSADARDILGQVGTFGMTAPSRENEIEFHAVLTIDEAQPD